MYRATNPYITNKSVANTAAFVGRADILREVLVFLDNPEEHSLVLHGQRHIGKSSVLQHLTAILPKDGNYYLIYFDLQDKTKWSLEKLLNELAIKIAQALDKEPPDLGEQAETEFMETWLPDVLDSLPEESKLVLLFDEFDEQAEPENSEAGFSFFPYLRQLRYRVLPQLKFIFAMGRNVDDIDNMAIYLFRARPPVKSLSVFNYEDTKTLVRLSEKDRSLKWPEEAIERVWQYTQGHPLFTQQVCFQVWEYLHRNKSQAIPRVSPSDVDNVIVEVLDASRAHLERLWDSLPPVEQVTASSLAEAGPEPITEPALEKWLYENGIRVVIQDLQNAPQRLQEWQWLTFSEEGYSFSIEIMRRWIKENKPLQRTQNELDRIDPVADKLFHAGLELYQNGELTNAVQKLSEATRLNPSHLAAQQLLADILLAQGETKKAKDLLESLYNYKPLAARSRLIQALLVLAQESEQIKEQLRLYEQVLALEPEQPEANARRKEILQKIAEDALAANNLRIALKAYQKLGYTAQVTEIENQIRENYFNIQNEFDGFKQAKSKQIKLLIAGFVLSLVASVWVSWGAFPKMTVALETAQKENAKIRKEYEESQLEMALQKNELEKAQGKSAQLEKALEQAKLKIARFEDVLRTVSEKTELGKFLSKLEKGKQVVIIASYNKKEDADKYYEKVQLAYPELFYPQKEVLPNLTQNIYQRGKIWEIFISGFYSRKSARALRNKVKSLDLIKDAFIRKNPF
jgi:tetratricopeptide (TPR) repeat protein